jgi:hypothetical protein
MIGLTFFLHQDERHPDRCEIVVESYSDYTSSGHEAEIAEKLVVAVLKAMRLEQSICVIREGSRKTVKGKLTVYDTEIFEWLRRFFPE